MLVVRISGNSVPKSWHRWGHPLSPNALRVWTFPLSASMDLADLVEALMLETPSHLHGQCLAVWVNPDFDGRLPFSVLEELEPLGVLHTRLHEPWIMGDLSALVRTEFRAVVRLQARNELLGYQTPCSLEHPERGRIKAQELFQIARIAQRTEDVAQACQISALLRKSESLPRGIPVFVRAHPHNLLSHELRRHPSYACVERLAINPNDIIIELIGPGLLDEPERLIQSSAELRRMGFRIALGDIGTGLSQVSLIADLEPEFVNLSPILIRAAQYSSAGGLLLGGFVEAVNRLGIDCIAEGIDTVDTLRTCRTLGITYGQGQLIGPVAPVPLAPDPLPNTRPQRMGGKRRA